MTSIGLTSQLYRNAKMFNLNFYGTAVTWIFNLFLFWTNICHHFMYPLVALVAQYIPPTSSNFYLLYEISVGWPQDQNKTTFITYDQNLHYTFPTCGHILHWYFLPLPPPLVWCPWCLAFTGWGTTSPPSPPWPDWPTWAGGDDEAEELLRWP